LEQGSARQQCAIRRNGGYVSPSEGQLILAGSSKAPEFIMRLEAIQAVP